MSDTRAKPGHTYTPRQRLGIALIVLSCVFYVMLIAVPLIPVDTPSQITLAAGLVIATEGSFWLGCLVAGKDIIAYLRSKLLPSLKRVLGLAGLRRTTAAR